MNPISDYLRDVKGKKGIKSDRQFAIQIGLSTGMICNILGGANVPSDDACKKIAQFAGDPVEKVLILAAESRAPESSRTAWERILKAASKAGLFTLGLFMLWLAAPTLAQASSEQTVAAYAQGTSLHNAPIISIMRHKPALRTRR